MTSTRQGIIITSTASSTPTYGEIKSNSFLLINNSGNFSMALKERTHSQTNTPHSSITNSLIEYLIIREALGKAAN
jgi:hypothetical protein